MKKRLFSSAERYAVWLHHEKRCWLCREPLRLVETTIDHYLPESLLDQPDQFAVIRTQWGLPETFNINGFENWLPSHQHCNQLKGATNFEFTPAHSIIVQRLLKRAPEVQKTAMSIGANTNKDKVIGYILAALERQAITLDDLQIFAQQLPTEADMIRLDTGYWLHKRDVARECDCRCERNHCVDSNKKVHCYFSRGLSDWVIEAGLYWKCYDQIVICPRCLQSHKRGHIGRAEICGRPYRDQARQTDEA
jgi:hypothetical protein